MRKHLRTILLVLLLGAIVNVAVAWACALWLPCPYIDAGLIAPEDSRWPVEPPPGFGERPTRENTFRRAGLQWHVSESRYVPQDFYQLQRTKLNHIDEEIAFIKARLSKDDADAERARKNLASLNALRDRTWAGVAGFLPGSRPAEEFCAVETGWPLRCLHGHQWSIARGNPTQDLSEHNRPLASGAIVTDINPLVPPGRGRPPRQRLLPLHPVPLAFLANTLLYAALLWLLIPGPLALRRIIRRRRGQCIQCAYDLRGAPADSAQCPECGAVSPRPS